MFEHHPFRVFSALALTALLTVACQQQESTTTETTATIDTATDTARATNDTASTTTMPVPAVNVSEPDRSFATKAAESGLAEAAQGQLAAQKATHPDVKSYGQRMVTDHGAANSELMQLAQTKGLTLPTAPAQEHQAALQHLSGLSGTEFDKAFMMHMVQDHEKAVKDFESAMQGVTDPELKAWATKTLPVLQDHLRVAKETQAKVK